MSFKQPKTSLEFGLPSVLFDAYSQRNITVPRPVCPCNRFPFFRFKQESFRALEARGIDTFRRSSRHFFFQKIKTSCVRMTKIYRNVQNSGQKSPLTNRVRGPYRKLRTEIVGENEDP